MNTATVELSNVIYNAATQSFEALATVYDGGHSRRIACSINAPIDMNFEAAAHGLSKQALRRHAGHADLTSQRIDAPYPALRAGRASLKGPFDAFAMLRRLAA
jgi:hypothetical protein